MVRLLLINSVRLEKEEEESKIGPSFIHSFIQGHPFIAEKPWCCLVPVSPTPPSYSLINNYAYQSDPIPRGSSARHFGISEVNVFRVVFIPRENRSRRSLGSLLLLLPANGASAGVGGGGWRVVLRLLRVRHRVRGAGWTYVFFFYEYGMSWMWLTREYDRQTRE